MEAGSERVCDLSKVTQLRGARHTSKKRNRLSFIVVFCLFVSETGWITTSLAFLRDRTFSFTEALLIPEGYEAAGFWQKSWKGLR